MKRRLMVAALVLIPVVIFGPTVLTLGWHLLHGRTVLCANRTIYVPTGWYPNVDYRTVHLSKLASTVLTGKTATALITLGPVPIPPKNETQKETAYKSFSSVYWTHLADPSGTTRGPLLKGSGETEAICIETSSSQPDAQITAECLIYRGTWSASFVGNPKAIETFYQIIDTNN